MKTRSFFRGESFRSMYERELATSLARNHPVEILREEDLSKLPPLVKAYVVRSGAVGKPRMTRARSTWSGRMKRNHGGKWMSIRVEQYDSFEEPATRLFLMKASLAGIPFEAFHRYVGARASMNVRVASLFDVVDARGPEMNRSETVTFFNDLCVLAPGALPFAAVEWTELDDRTVRAAYANADQRIEADLSFDAAGDLVGFSSPDRYQSEDGRTFELIPWSTPLRDHRDFGGVRLPAHGDAIWKERAGDFLYAEFDLQTIDYGFSGAAASRKVA